ncbi:UDP-N-acetylmuramoyl-tripeptide--D-alanyl-D-alanine ligase [Candidatus Neomarinimicrobiota bacterium]
MIIGLSLTHSITGIATDSRLCEKDDLFIAIKGDHVDGHSFLQEIYDKGCRAALVSDIDNSLPELNQYLVKDPVMTIGELAKRWRKNFDFPVIAITGTNGKTSTKELLSHILQPNYNVHANKGNYNTSVSLPLTVLQMSSEHSIAIFELGANQPGDIKYLCDVLHPTHGIITNIAPAHLEGFGSIDEIAFEKGELFRALANGISFINQTDDRVAGLPTFGEKITYGLTPESDFPADFYTESEGTLSIMVDAEDIPTGSSNVIFVKNVLAAITIARTLEISWDTIKKQILFFNPPSGRCVVTNYGKNTVIDDTYNANYESVSAAIDFLKGFGGTGRRIFAFGDMYELGEYAREYHEKVGEKCNESELDIVFTVGNYSQYTDAVLKNIPLHHHFSSKTELGKELSNIISEDDIILFKGSRGMTMETIIQEVFQS